MNSGRNNLPVSAPSITLADVYFVVFRHKWMILILTLLGVGAAVAFYHLRQPPFESRAQLMVKYIPDKEQSTPGDVTARVTSFIDMEETALADEVSIITSMDLAEAVATNVGPAKILAMLGGGDNAQAAAGVIYGGLKVEVSHNSSVIIITFRHPDQTVVRPVVQAYIDAYHDKSKEIHTESSADLADSAEELRGELGQTERELINAKTNAGIINVEEAERAYSAQISRLRGELSEAKVELAEYQSAKGSNDPTLLTQPKYSGDTNSQGNLPIVLVEKYKTVCAQLKYLQKKHDDYVAVEGYTDENKLVKEVSEKLTENLKEKTDLEAEYPALALQDTTPADANGSSDNNAAASGAINFATLPAKIKTLEDLLEEVQAQSAQLEQAAQKIDELEDRKAMLQAKVKEFDTTLQQAQIDAAMGPGQGGNIPSIEHPTAPFRDYSKFYKVIFGLCFGGFFLGLALAFVIEFFLDRSIKRPIEIQTKLKIPFFLSIPDLSRGASKQLVSSSRQLTYNANGDNGNGSAKPAKTNAKELAKWELNRRFNSYYDALRDRLVVYFESINLTRKPKLVAVTSTHRGSGVSTIAAGLAASLSETGDGRVLLVDMNEEKGAAQQFYRGEASCKLDDALTSEKRDNAMVQDNLYVVTEDTISDKLPRALPRRFASLIPKLKASDYDYIIFDMPPVSPTSVTSRLAGFMDTVMLVIESEKTDQQVVQQANALLAQSKANVTAVLNKTKTYIPARLHQDFLSDS